MRKTIVFFQTLVGQESSGVQYNTIRLDKCGRPHNPMINAGSILMSSQYEKELSNSERHNQILRLMKKIAGLKEDGKIAGRFNTYIQMYIF